MVGDKVGSGVVGKLDRLIPPSPEDSGAGTRVRGDGAWLRGGGSRFSGGRNGR